MALIVALAPPIQAQTYKVGSDASEKPQTPSDQSPPPGQPLGWGSNIQNARLAAQRSRRSNVEITRLRSIMPNAPHDPLRTIPSSGSCLGTRRGSMASTANPPMPTSKVFS
jgi:hypothetical protein